MCEANAYIQRDGHEELIMQSVNIMEPEGEDSWRLVDIFNNQTMIHGRIREMCLVDHKIVFVEVS